MARVEFTTRDGREVSFQATGKRAAGWTPDPSEYNLFIGERVPVLMRDRGMSAKAAFKQAVREWKGKKMATKTKRTCRGQGCIGNRPLTEIMAQAKRKVRAQKQRRAAAAPKQQKRKPINLGRLIGAVKKQKKQAKAKGHDPIAQRAAARRARQPTPTVKQQRAVRDVLRQAARQRRQRLIA